ncbi:MAG: GNAT family N-acetyltransferase [Pseudomonadota bacterium]
MGAPLIDLRPAIRVRPAQRRDAPTLARLANMAGEGLPRRLWKEMAKPGEDPMAVGARRAARSTGAFSWRNAHVATWHGAPVGASVDYDIDAADPPGPDLPGWLHPLVALEARAVGTRHVNMLAVVPQARRRGAANALLTDIAGRTGRDLSLIVASGNRVARAFYAAWAFEERARHPVGKAGSMGGDWILLTRAAMDRRPDVVGAPVRCG